MKNCFCVFLLLRHRHVTIVKVPPLHCCLSTIYNLVKETRLFWLLQSNKSTDLWEMQIRCTVKGTITTATYRSMYSIRVCVQYMVVTSHTLQRYHFTSKHSLNKSTLCRKVFTDQIMLQLQELLLGVSYVCCHSLWFTFLVLSSDIVSL